LNCKQYLWGLKLTHQLDVIEQAALDKEEENFHFKQFLSRQDADMIDASVHALNEVISAQVDCTSCGNCCQSLMINVTEPESEALAAHLALPVTDFKEKYIETSLQGDMIVNTIPCHFLNNRRCTVYEYRFAECRNFPGLHQPDFNGRLFSTFMHYGRCPIIYNVVEELKVTLDFHAQQTAL
jgi:uncharacterized protein